MKLQKQFVPFLILIFLFAGSVSQAQTKKEKEETEKELRLMELEIKKDQHQKQQELEKMLKESKIMEEEELKAILEEQKNHAQAIAKYRTKLGNYEFRMKDMEHIVVPEIKIGTDLEGQPASIWAVYGGNRESTVLNIHKDINDVTFSTKFKYEVQKGSKSFKFSANGSVEKGTIMIQLLNPGDQVIHEFEVSPLADVDWTQSFKWNEEDAEGNSGTWTIIVSAKQATGNYSVNVRAN